MGKAQWSAIKSFATNFTHFLFFSTSFLIPISAATTKRVQQKRGGAEREGVGQVNARRTLKRGEGGLTDRVVHRKGANGHLIYVASLDIPHIAKKCACVCVCE